MVNILIKFKRILEKLSLGNMLEENEIKYVKGFLGYKIGINHLIGLLAFAFFFSLFFLLILYNYLFWGSLCLILGIIFLLYYVPVFINPLKNYYDKALENYLIVNLGKSNFVYTTYLVQSGFSINKSLVYFIYDDYYFKIQEDFLKIEHPKKNVIFKYPDLDCSTNNSISFKLQDIVSYESNDRDLQFSSNNYADLVKKIPSYNTNFRIDLNNFKSISLGDNVYPYFKSLIKEKEK